MAAASPTAVEFVSTDESVYYAHHSPVRSASSSYGKYAPVVDHELLLDEGDVAEEEQPDEANGDEAARQDKEEALHASHDVAYVHASNFAPLPPTTGAADEHLLDVDPSPQPPTASASPSSSPSSSLAERTALVRSVLVQRVDAVLTMSAAEEHRRTEAERIMAPVTFQPNEVDGAEAAAAAAPVARAKLSLGTVLSTYIPARLLGIAYLSLSAIIFSIMALFVSLLAKYMPSFQIVWFRCVCQFSFAWLACQSQGVNFLGPREKRKWLFIRGAVGCISFSLFYYAIQHLTLADSTTIFFTAPLYTGIFGYLFLREIVTRFDLVCTLASVVGVVLVVRPVFLFGTTTADVGGVTTDGGTANPDDPNVNTGSEHTLGVFAAILGSLVSACVYIAIRKVGPGVHPLVFVCWMGLVGVFLTPFGGLVQTWVWPSNIVPWMYVVFIGIFSFTGQILFNAGVQKEKAGPASMIRNLDVVFSFVWQVTIEGILPNAWSVVGAVVISASVVAMGVRKWKMQEQQAAATPAAPTSMSPGATTADANAPDGAPTSPTSTSVALDRAARTRMFRSDSGANASAGLALQELAVHEEDVEQEHEEHAYGGWHDGARSEQARPAAVRAARYR